MLSKCANPRCTAGFRYLHEGKLFRMEIAAIGGKASSPAENGKKPPRRTEFFWLCGTCSAQMTLAYGDDFGVTTRPLPVRRAVAGL